MGTNKSRIFIPKNSENLIFYSATIVNLNGDAGQFAFRMNLENGKTFKKLEYSLGLEDWVDINNRDRAANLYTINIPEGSTRLILRIRVSTNYEPRIIRYFNLQPTSNIEIMDGVTLDSIPGMFAHYDSEDVLVNENNKVHFMFDKTGNGHRMEQSQSTLMPDYVTEDSDFNNYPSVSFSGNNQRMEYSQFITAEDVQDPPNTYIMVFKHEDLANTGTMFDGVRSSERNGLRLVLSDGVTAQYQMTGFGGERTIRGPQATTNTHLGIFRFDVENSDGFLDGGVPVFEEDLQRTADPMAGIVLGADYTRTDYKQFKLAEFIMWNRRLDNLEVNFIGETLSQKYGITWTDMEVN